MSTRIIEDDTLRWTFGWDQYNHTFFLTKLDKSLVNESNPSRVFKIGIRPWEVPHAEGLFTLALMVGLDLPYEVRSQLEQDKELEQHEYYVLHYPDEFVLGFKTDSLAIAESLKESLGPIRSDKNLQIRRVTEYVKDDGD